MHEPAPTRVKAIQDPERLAHRASHVRRRGVYGYHEIELVDQGRSIGEILQMTGIVEHCRAIPFICEQFGQLRLRRLTLLQAVELDICTLQRGKLG